MSGCCCRIAKLLPSIHLVTTSKQVRMWPCLWLCAVQLQALMRTIWVHAVPMLGVVMALVAIWSLLLSGVRPSG